MYGSIGYELLSDQARLEKALTENQGRYIIDRDGSIALNFDSDDVQERFQELFRQLEHIEPES
ncbi:hypothetical protein QNS20_002001 [Enterobacter ludwigii]|nr:hypothetical protein [Enterobacter ludwigii]